MIIQDTHNRLKEKSKINKLKITYCKNNKKQEVLKNKTQNKEIKG